MSRGGNILDISQNMSSHPGGTKLALYDFTHQEGFPSYQHTPQYITAPEQCIYRHDPGFARALSNVLHGTILNGQCHISGSRLMSCCCYSAHEATNSDDRSQLSTIGMNTVTRTFYNNGNANYSNITRWFDEIAVAITNRFRTGYMSAASMSNNGTGLISIIQDPGFSCDIQGLAWQTAGCVSMHWQWLLLPFILAFLTASLSMWTIVKNWQHRHSRPMWKESILPLILYGYKIKCEEPELFSGHALESAVTEEGADLTGSGNVLLEASEMIELSERVAITFN